MTLGNVLFLGRYNCEVSNSAMRYLQKHCNKLDVIWSKDMSESLPEFVNNWEGDYIVSFMSFFILPKSLLNKAKKDAINFHPGPPKYRGRGAASFAIYNDDRIFGVTAHLIDELIDNGKIFAVLEFSIEEGDTVETIVYKSRKALYELFILVFDNILLDGNYIQRSINSCKHEWSGKLRSIKEIDSLRKIKLDITKNELDKIIKATAIGTTVPYIELYGHKFVFRKM
jgi:methionyl-tRNA formyltransferase